ncbi:MAG: DNA methylase [Desulfobacteraceae bacterium]|nr:DNA methylase [Desulfobacteraceae bacterium]
MTSMTGGQKQLARLESLISRNQKHFCEAGRALKEIRDNRLYKLALFDTFEVYTRSRWDISRAHAYRLIQYCEVIRNLSPIGDVLPANESQVRHLAQLRPIEQRRTWKDFLASGSELTAQNIKRFITARGIKKPDPPDWSDRITPEYMAAVKTMLEQVRVARHDNWQGTSRQAALLWNRVVKEKILSKGTGDG